MNPSIEMRKIVIASALISSLLLLSMGLFSRTVTANPMLAENTNNIVFNEHCPNDEKVCSGHLLDCLGGCALNATTGETLFKWERTIVEETADADRVIIQTQKSCLNRDAIQAALLKALETTPDYDSKQSLCLVKGPTWQYMHATFDISPLAPDTCDTATPLLSELADGCQSFGQVASYTAKAVGITLGAAAGFACISGAAYLIYRKCQGKNSLRVPFSRPI